jgi:imidazolonepropionase-like amidohydrolase
MFLISNNLKRRLLIILLPLLLVNACSNNDEPALVSEDNASNPETSGAVIYEGARLIIGDGSPAIENGVFLVEQGVFQLVGSASSVSLPTDARRVDLRGMTVMPAIIDTHTHLNIERAALLEDLRKRTVYGVSAALSLGRDFGIAPFEIQQQNIQGTARFLTAGRGITSPEPGRTEDPHWVSTEEEARAAVREEAALGVDFIKVWVDDRDGQYEKLSEELYRAVIDEAWNQDLRVTAHIFELEDAKGLLRAGVSSFAHGVRDQPVDEEFIRMIKARPYVVLVPNLNERGVITDLSWLAGTMPDSELQELQAAQREDTEAQASYALQAANLAVLNDAGVSIALGTDGNTPWGPHLEMEDMVLAGMSPMEVISAATANAADFLALDNMGAIMPGKKADFIVLEANPLDDITNTRRIREVYIDGLQIER